MTGIILTIAIITLTITTSSITTRLLLNRHRNDAQEADDIIDYAAELIAMHIRAIEEGNTSMEDQTRAHLKAIGITINETDQT